jgi:hypothetical protein
MVLLKKVDGITKKSISYIKNKKFFKPEKFYHFCYLNQMRIV